MLIGLVLALLTASAPAPDPAAPGAPAASPAPAAVPSSAETIEAERKLGLRLAGLRDVAAQTDLCLSLAWSDAEPDAQVREAALRRLRSTDPHLLAEEIPSLSARATPKARVGMLGILEEVHHHTGGKDLTLDYFIADRIRDPDPEVSSAAMSVCARLGIRESYLPLREIVENPSSPLRSQAIETIAAIADPRAVGFFERMLATSGAPRQEIFAALAKIGRPASLVIKQKLDDPDPETRRMAVEALLEIADVEDLSSLYAFIEKHPPNGELKTKIYDTIARVESHANERRLDGD